MKKGLFGLLVLGALLVAPSGALASGGGFCALNGTANFTTPLTTTAKDFGYSFHGTLGPCGGTDGTALTALVSAGESIAGFPEPKPSGNGSCTSSTTSGTSFVQWADGTLTIVDYDTTGAAAAVALTGTVRPNITLSKTDPVTGITTSRTFTSTRYAGGYSGGPLAFEPPDPTACNGAGVTTAGIQGMLGVGGP